MANLSITTAWNEASAFVRREAHLLFPIAFLLGSLPGVAMQLLAPQQPPAPGQTPELGAWLLLMPLAFLLTVVSGVAISYLALRPGASVGDALSRALRRFLAVFGAFLIIGFGFGLIFLAVGLLVVALVPGAESVAAGGAPSQEALGSIVLLLLLILPLAFYFMVRLSLTTPVAAGEDVGPIGIIRRSWALSRGNFWRILGFILLSAIAFGIAAMAVQFVIGAIVMLVAGPPEPGSLSMLILLLVNAVLSAIFSMYFVATMARIYAQLTGHRDVAEVFR